MWTCGVDQTRNHRVPSQVDLASARGAQRSTDVSGRSDCDDATVSNGSRIDHRTRHVLSQDDAADQHDGASLRAEEGCISRSQKRSDYDCPIETSQLSRAVASPVTDAAPPERGRNHRLHERQRSPTVHQRSLALMKLTTASMYSAGIGPRNPAAVR
jgi:hypothetical protein